MKPYFSTLFISLGLLSGCASDETKRMENASRLATQRAAELSVGLPVQRGPLHILSAQAQKNIVTIKMIYNNQATGTPELTKSTIAYYCKDQKALNMLNEGGVYRIFMRNEKGIVILDHFLDSTSCQTQNSNDAI